MVSDNLIAIYKVHEFLTESPPSTSTFSERMMAQKVGYLSQVVGVYLGDYQYNWYKKGPYSSGFADEIFEITRNINNVIKKEKNMSLTDEAKVKLEPLKEIISHKPQNLSQSRWLELIASLHYIKTKICNQTKEQVFQVLIDKKPYFSNYNTNNYAWRLMKNTNLI